jgi:5'-nucleotidase (lipoprotein e(P4) family)
MIRLPVLLAIALVSAPLVGAGQGALARKPAALKPVPATQPAPAVPQQLHGMQYLYGSAEAAALTRQAWRALADFVDGELAANIHRGVVLTPDSTLATPRFVDCGDRPPAVVFDVDETVLLNLGAEYDDLVSGRATFDNATWDRWEKTGANYVAPTPGAKEALDRLRSHGVTVIFNTNRAAANVTGAEAALNVAGLGPARHGETLYLMGDDATGSRKDGRRQVIAAKYCVLAMGGDQLGDFSDLFNSEPNGVAARRDTVAFSGIADMWGNGWFVMPNPVYGSALKGGPDDIFAKDKQWRDPGGSPAASDAPVSTPTRAQAPAKVKH